MLLTSPVAVELCGYLWSERIGSLFSEQNGGGMGEEMGVDVTDGHTLISVS